MAEFCLDCWGKINGEEVTESQYVLSEELEICEGCGEWKRVIISERSFLDCLIFHPIKLINKIICIFQRWIESP